MSREFGFEELPDPYQSKSSKFLRLYINQRATEDPKVCCTFLRHMNDEWESYAERMKPRIRAFFRGSAGAEHVVRNMICKIAKMRLAARSQAQRAGRRRVIHAFSDGCVLKDVCVLLGRWVHLRGVDEVPFTRISINKDYNADRHRDEGNARELPTAVRALNCFQKNKR